MRNYKNTNTSSDRAAIAEEVDGLIAELDRIGETTEFNNKKLLCGVWQQNGTEYFLWRDDIFLSASVVPPKLQALGVVKKCPIG